MIQIRGSAVSTVAQEEATGVDDYQIVEIEDHRPAVRE